MLSLNGFAQNSMAELLTKYNNETIPYLSVDELTKEDATAIGLSSEELKSLRSRRALEL